MSDPGDWLKVVDDEGTEWSLDAAFLRSNWACIWGAGCKGIEATPDETSILGCCSVGAELLDDDEAMRIAALAATIDHAHLQFADELAAGGPYVEPSFGDRRHTRVVDGACIFLNRKDFARGAGCALHAEAIRSGESITDWKPAICWQLPIRVERPAEGAATLRAWSRADWGPEGDTMAWCCTEQAEAHVGEVPVVVSLREELTALLGEDAYAAASRALADGGVSPA